MKIGKQTGKTVMGKEIFALIEVNRCGGWSKERGFSEVPSEKIGKSLKNL